MQIEPRLPEIIDLISHTPVTTIVAATGSGKSLAVPAAIGTTGARCFVSVPTRTAAISLSNYQTSIQQARGEAAVTVGYAAGGRTTYDRRTRIVYATAGHVKLKMLNYVTNGEFSDLDFCEVLMVDEIHIGTIDNTLILALYAEAVRQGVAVPRLVMASATPVQFDFLPSVTLEVIVNNYPVETVYLSGSIDFDSKELFKTAATIAYNIHRHEPGASGHILIFTPGEAEVREVINKFEEYPKTAVQDIVIPAYSALTADELKLLYLDTTPDQRKIIVATNIAETSITIANIGFIIDTMLEKRAVGTAHGGKRLETQLISQDSAIQRQGRTGRTGPGQCYRICTYADFLRLPQHRVPEIEIVPIYDTLMDILATGLDPVEILPQLTPVRVESALRVLFELGMITEQEDVLPKGTFSSKFPIGVNNTAFLYDWIYVEHLPPFAGIVTAALIDCYGPSYFWLPRRDHGEVDREYNQRIAAYMEEYFARFTTQPDDLSACLEMWNALMEESGGYENIKQSRTRSWSKGTSINYKKIVELLEIIDECVSKLLGLGVAVAIGPFTVAGVVQRAIPLLVTAYPHRAMKLKGREYFNPSTKESAKIDNRSISSLKSARYPVVLALAIQEIKSREGHITRMLNMAVPAPKSALDIETHITTKPARTRKPKPNPKTTPKLTPKPNPKTTPKSTPKPTPKSTPKSTAAAGKAKARTPTPKPKPKPVLATTSRMIDPVATSVLVSFLYREYARYVAIQSIISSVNATLEEYRAREFINILERWLVAVSEVPSLDDRLFDTAKLLPTHSDMVKFKSELEEKQLDATKILPVLRQRLLLYLDTVEHPPVKYSVKGTRVQIGTFIRDIARDRIDKLLQLGTSLELCILCMRYACILSRGQQWNVPLAFYRYLESACQVTLEGFASPFNSQMMLLNTGKYCSVFPDTDTIYGSVGSFFNQRWMDKRAVINPPYLELLMNSMARVLLAACDASKSCLFVITTPRWVDAEYYLLLSQSSHTVHVIELGKGEHYYEDSNYNPPQRRSNQATTVFVLNVGVTLPDSFVRSLKLAFA
jgi:hypothetical protein